MTDFEKVVKGLECCGANSSCLGCPYINYLNNGCMDKLNADAVALIREQQKELIQLRRANQQLKEWASDFTEGEK